MTILVAYVARPEGQAALDKGIEIATRRNEALVEGSRERLRPILMTTLAALFGAIPLMLASGSGAELRQPLGVTIVGGLIIAPTRDNPMVAMRPGGSGDVARSHKLCNNGPAGKAARCKRARAGKRQCAGLAASGDIEVARTAEFHRRRARLDVVDLGSQGLVADLPREGDEVVTDLRGHEPRCCHGRHSMRPV